MSDQNRKNNPISGSSAAQDAKELKDQAANEAKDVKDQVAGQAREVADRAASEARNLKDQVASEAQHLKEEAQHQVSAVVSENKTRAADEIGSVAQAFKETGRRLREEDHGAVAQYADQLGDQVERVASYLRDRDVSTMIHDLENMARRQPALFIGGAVAVGLLASRFLKSSASGMRRSGSYGDYSGGRDRDYRSRDYGSRAYGREYLGSQYGVGGDVRGGGTIGGGSTGGSTGGTDVGSTLTSDSLRNEVDDRRPPTSAQPGLSGGTTTGTTSGTTGSKADDTGNKTDQSKEK